MRARDGGGGKGNNRDAKGKGRGKKTTSFHHHCSCHACVLLFRFSFLFFLFCIWPFFSLFRPLSSSFKQTRPSTFTDQPSCSSAHPRMSIHPSIHPTNQPISTKDDDAGVVSANFRHTRARSGKKGPLPVRPPTPKTHEIKNDPPSSSVSSPVAILSSHLLSRRVLRLLFSFFLSVEKQGADLGLELLVCQTQPAVRVFRGIRGENGFVRGF